VREGKRIAAAAKAADWFVRVSDAPVSRQDRSRYLGWLKQSPMHVAETLRLLHVCGLLRSMARRQSAETQLETSQQVS
jgi:ferric-dicitrate binding protein FerR (iron transport regulator)